MLRPLILFVVSILATACGGPVKPAENPKPSVSQTPNESDPPCGDPAALASEAMTSGARILSPVTLGTSTPIGDVLANPSNHEGKLVRIEGVVVGVCQKRGCYVTLQDRAGQKMNLKVIDGELDFRDHVKLGNYVVGEGVATEMGEHGPQINIMKGGAMVGSRVCAGPSSPP